MTGRTVPASISLRRASGTVRSGRISTPCRVWLRSIASSKSPAKATVVVARPRH